MGMYCIIAIFHNVLFFYNIDIGLIFISRIRYLAHGPSQRIIAKSYCHNTYFASRNVMKTGQVLRTVLAPVYMSARTEELWTRNAEQFYDLWNFPKCVGVTDGKHISAEVRGSATFNYKTHIIILLIILLS